jgi:two-component system, NarL family, sensor kinase
MPASRSGKNGKSAAQEIKRLRTRVQELEETFLAIQGGRVDAVVVNGTEGDQVFTLQGAEHPYRVLVETMNEGAATLDKDGTVLYANASFAGILGVRLDSVIGTPLQSHFSPQEESNLKNLIGNGIQGESRGEVSLTGPEGLRRLVRLSLSPVHDFGMRTICVVATDMTELAGANQALKASEEALRNLSGRLLRLQDEERRRISRDLHDVTGQKLALLSMDLSSIVKHKEIAKNEEMNRLLLEAVALSNDLNKEIRTLSYLLHPPLLDELGLSSAVEWFSQGFENRTGIRVGVDIPNGFARLAPDAEVALFRIVQESLANVHRYSGSATAYVRARSDGGEVRLEIGDFGKGIYSESTKKVEGLSVAPLGVGIQGMKERVRQLSGTLEITSRPGRGTLVTAILPISNRRVEISESERESQLHDVSMIAELAPAAPSVGWRKRILIADDHDVLRRGIRTMLESDPELEVCGEAVDGKDALEKTLSQAPDLVILDINMPVMNGLDVLRQIVRHRPQTKVLAFSVHDSKQIVDEILAAVAHSYLSKATAGQHLVHEVRLLLSGRLQAELA